MVSHASPLSPLVTTCGTRLQRRKSVLPHPHLRCSTSPAPRSHLLPGGRGRDREDGDEKLGDDAKILGAVCQEVRSVPVSFHSETNSSLHTWGLTSP